MGDPAIRYRVAFPHPETHLYQIVLEIDGLAPGSHRLEMAVWTPGSYLVREFSGHVHGLNATDGEGRPLTVVKESKNVWRLETPAASVRVRYEVYANEPTVDTSHLDASHAYWNGASLFLGVDGRKDLPVEVQVDAPVDWALATGLDNEGGPDGHWVLRARDYDTLLDCPVEIGTHRTFAFEAMGRPHEVALYGHGNEDPQRLIADLRRIVEASGAIFGALPYERYVFIIHLLDGRGGGLEHLNSTTCDVDRFAFRPEASYLALLPLFSHEFFHLWNVKRIHPEALGPFRYGEENYTTLLWAMEGITDYYAGLLLVRAGLWSPRKYAQHLAGEIRDYECHPGRLVQSAAGASFDAWIKLYRPDPGSINHTISYYTKGSLLGLCLDLLLRGGSGGDKGLDDVLRLLFERYGRHGRGFPDAAYKATVEEVAGTSLDDFWRRFVEGTDELDPGRFLVHAGLDLERRRSRSDLDGDEANRPVDAGSTPMQGAPRAHLGLVWTERAGRLFARNVLRGGPAERAGVNADDEILAIDGFRVESGQALAARVRDRAPGAELVVTLSRRGELREQTVRLGEAPPDAYAIRPRADASDAARAVYRSWLGHAFAPPDGLQSENMKPERALAHLV